MFEFRTKFGALNIHRTGQRLHPQIDDITASLTMLFILVLKSVTHTAIFVLMDSFMDWAKIIVLNILALVSDLVESVDFKFPPTQWTSGGVSAQRLEG